MAGITASDLALKGDDQSSPTCQDVQQSSGKDVQVQDVAVQEHTAVSKFGMRPECFRNTFQEVAFVFMATIAMATNTFLTGSTVIVTAAIGKDLGMTQSQISWISAAAT